MKSKQCEFCREDFNSVRYFFHSFWQMIAMILLIVRYVSWSIYTLRFKMKEQTKIPCKTCRHQCWLHLIIAEDDNCFGSSFDPSDLLFYRYQVSNPLEQQCCLLCGILYIYHRGKTKDQTDHGFCKMDNLEYLEMKSK